VDATPIEILLVEDDPGDVLIMRRALETGMTTNTVHVVGDGETAMRFLRRETGHQHVPRPDLILLDLNLPEMDGREVLAAIKSDPDLKRIPVVVLTTSSAEADVLRSYDLHANLYVSKPVELDKFLETVSAIVEFFDTVVRLPHR